MRTQPPFPGRLPYAVDVQWRDGQTETFEVWGMTIGKESLQLELTDGSVRHVPLLNVRWYDYGRRVPA